MSLTKVSSLVESIVIYKKRLIQLTMNFYERFQSLLGQRLQYTLIEESESSLKGKHHRVPLSSDLRLLLFILYINGMYNSVKNCKTHHSAGDTNLLLTSSSLKQKSKQTINYDHSLICRWLRANKVCLNTTKSEIIIFWPSKNQTTKHLNLRIIDQQISTCGNVKYLSITLVYRERNLHLNLLKLKLIRAISLLRKTRHYGTKFLLKILYYTIFHSYPICAC